MSIPNNTIGYFAIIVPDMDEYQGAFLTDDPETRSQVNLTMTIAMMSGANPYGVLQAMMAECFVEAQPLKLGIAARAYAALTKDRFFYVVASRDDKGGWDTEATAFKGTTIAACQKELQALPITISMRAKRSRH